MSGERFSIHKRYNDGDRRTHRCHDSHDRANPPKPGSYSLLLPMIHVIRNCATPAQMQQMLESLGIYIKLAVDVEGKILAGGGELHADCEQVLLSEGSNQAHIWGADWYPLTQTVGYESIINIRSRSNNRSTEIQDPALRDHIHQIVQTFLGKVAWQ
jgi:Protein of unknown function (DUF5674)